MCKVENQFKRFFGYHPRKDVRPPLKPIVIQKRVAKEKQRLAKENEQRNNNYRVRVNIATHESIEAKEVVVRDDQGTKLVRQTLFVNSDDSTDIIDSKNVIYDPKF